MHSLLFLHFKKMFFTYVKYIGKSVVTFCYHECNVERGRKGKNKTNVFLEEEGK